MPEPHRPDRPARPTPLRRAALADVAVVLLLFVVAGVTAGVVWPHLVTPVEVVCTDLGTVRDEGALVHRISNDGWYSLLAAVGGLVLGVTATAWRRSHEVLTVLAVVAGALLAAGVSAVLGGMLGPADPDVVLDGARTGATAPDVVRVYAEAAYLVWPASALLGALVVLWGPDPADRARTEEPQPDVSPTAAAAPPPRA